MVLIKLTAKEKHTQNIKQTQESIPVGCIPSAAVAVGGGGVCSRGVSAPGGVFALGGCLLGGVCIPASTEADTHPPPPPPPRGQNS